jgi:hypothetical protein
MKAYVSTTGVVFALLVLVHLWRVAEEGMRQAMDPFFAFGTMVSAALCIWAWRVYGKLPRS